MMDSLSNIQYIMKSNRESKEVKSITFSVGSFFKPDKFVYTLKENVENLGLIRSIYFEESKDLYDVHIQFDDFVLMFPSVKIEQIVYG